jgi:hypothetical protein
MKKKNTTMMKKNNLDYLGFVGWIALITVRYCVPFSASNQGFLFSIARIKFVHHYNFATVIIWVVAFASLRRYLAPCTYFE